MVVVVGLLLLLFLLLRMLNVSSVAPSWWKRRRAWEECLTIIISIIRPHHRGRLPSNIKYSQRGVCTHNQLRIFFWERGSYNFKKSFLGGVFFKCSKNFILFWYILFRSAVSTKNFRGCETVRSKKIAKFWLEYVKMFARPSLGVFFQKKSIELENFDRILCFVRTLCFCP